MRKILFISLFFISCNQGVDFKGGRVFEIHTNSNTLNHENDSLFDDETNIRLDSIKKSLLDSFATNNNRIKIGPKVKN
jgi:preprotein translocase subunit SecF